MMRPTEYPSAWGEALWLTSQWWYRSPNYRGSNACSSTEGITGHHYGRCIRILLIAFSIAFWYFGSPNCGGKFLAGQ